MSMASTASAPNRFWGVVALALNSVLQPAGQICGGTDSPALRLSPPFQIANTLSLIYRSVRLSFAIDLPFRTAVGVVAERAELYDIRSGITEPERHFFFRVLVFIFGALPAFIKALAIQGDRVSYSPRPGLLRSLRGTGINRAAGEAAHFGQAC